MSRRLTCLTRRQLQAAVSDLQVRVTDLERLRPPCCVCLTAPSTRLTVFGPMCGTCEPPASRPDLAGRYLP